MKVIESSTDLKEWKTFIGPGPDEVVEEAWMEVQKWIHEEQPFGFFRMIPFQFVTDELHENNKGSV
jgi:hypothetical protein